MNKKNIAIVILNWNGKALLKTFLPSVLTHSGEAVIYVADNASTDDSVIFVKTHYPTVKIIQNEVNGGYAKGYNDALKHVDEPIICLLNSDVEVTKDWLVPIQTCFDTEPKTAIIQPKILDYNNKTHFEYAGAAGGFIDKYGFPYCRGRIFNTIEKDIGQYDDTIDIFWASGACLFIRKSVFEHLDGFDESFFAHIEEIDLCWRAFNFGYTTKYIGNSTVYHVGGATLNAGNPQKTFLNFRNSLFALTKNLPKYPFPLIFIRLCLDGIAGLKFLAELKPKHTWAVIKSHFAYYAQLSKLVKQRRKLKLQISKANAANYFKVKSIVWLYFIKKHTKFKGF